MRRDRVVDDREPDACLVPIDLQQMLSPPTSKLSFSSTISAFVMFSSLLMAGNHSAQLRACLKRIVETGRARRRRGCMGVPDLSRNASG